MNEIGFDASQPNFDAEIMLALLENDRELAVIMLSTLIEDFPERVKALNTALAASDFGAARREAHTIKGLAKGAGALPLSALAYTIEISCRDGDSTTAIAAQAQIEGVAAQAMAAWHGFLAQDAA